MSVDSAEQSRAAMLFLQRWQEQVATTFVPRRAYTLSSFAAIDELIALGESHVRSGGSTRPAADPLDAGHGVMMLPDVADEVRQILSGDEILRRRYPVRRQVLQDHSAIFTSKENVTQEAIEQLRAIAGSLRAKYVEDGFAVAGDIVRSSPKAHEALVAVVDGLVSELRGGGWSDEGLSEAATRAEAESGGVAVEALAHLQGLVVTTPSEYECYIGVSLPPKRPTFPADDPTLALVETLPKGARSGRPLKAGPYLKVRVRSFDPAASAAVAHRRVVSTLGALRVFLPGTSVDVSSDVVGVLLPSGDTIRSVEVQERLLEAKRTIEPAEVTAILASSWKVSGLRVADPLHDAIRLRHRALLAADAESRLLLLWSGMERMTAGARGFDSALAAARELVSHAVTFGKLRRDIGDLVACISHEVSKDEKQKRALLALAGGEGKTASRVDRIRFIRFLMSDEAELRRVVATVYASSPLLAFRCHHLWTALGSGDPQGLGKHLAEYHERSRKRVSQQVARVYRARNRIAHVGSAPDRVRDLVWHAHFYLTQLTAICVHYGEHQSARAQEILVRRMGQYRAFIKLLRAGDPALLTPEALLRPSRAVGDPDS